MNCAFNCKTIFPITFDLHLHFIGFFICRLYLFWILTCTADEQPNFLFRGNLPLTANNTFAYEELTDTMRAAANQSGYTMPSFFYLYIIRSNLVSLDEILYQRWNTWVSQLYLHSRIFSFISCWMMCIYFPVKNQMTLFWTCICWQSVESNWASERVCWDGLLWCQSIAGPGMYLPCSCPLVNDCKCMIHVILIILIIIIDITIFIIILMIPIRIPCSSRQSLVRENLWINQLNKSIKNMFFVCWLTNSIFGYIDSTLTGRWLGISWDPMTSRKTRDCTWHSTLEAGRWTTCQPKYTLSSSSWRSVWMYASLFVCLFVCM